MIRKSSNKKETIKLTCGRSNLPQLVIVGNWLWMVTPVEIIIYQAYEINGFFEEWRRRRRK